MEAIRTFEDLECWKACRHFRLFVMRKIVSILPRDEKFELASQLRRAARSTTANIAEGYGRFHYRDNYKFCSNSRGSLFEVLDHLITANDDGYIDNELFAEGRALFEQARRLLNGYMNYLRNAASETAGLREDPIFYSAADDLIPWLDLSPP